MFHQVISLVNSALHSVEKREILSHRKNIPSNQLFSKTVAFTEILPKMWEREIPQFPQCIALQLDFPKKCNILRHLPLMIFPFS